MDDHPDARLTRALNALASPTRLGILRTLRRPRALHEIRVGSDSRAHAPMARQSVKEHLMRLEQASLVRTREGHGARGTTIEYLTNHLRIYEIAEELRELAHLRAAEETLVQTSAQPHPSRDHLPRPALVLVRGLSEGTAFRLPSSLATSVVLGRGRQCDLVLDFDSAISHEHCRVVAGDGGHAVEDLESRNGTFVNFFPIPRGQRYELRHGDIVGVGKTLLVYWA